VLKVGGGAVRSPLDVLPLGPSHEVREPAARYAVMAGVLKAAVATRLTWRPTAPRP
jgi:hypothetical protein